MTAVNGAGESVPYSVVATGGIALTLTILTQKYAPFEYKPPSLNRKCTSEEFTISMIFIYIPLFNYN